MAAGGFFEWAEFLGNLYGTPLPEPPEGSDVLLEIDLQGARQVRRLRPDARLILLVPPSDEVQAERLRARGDDEEHVAKRLRAGADEVQAGRRHRRRRGGQRRPGAGHGRCGRYSGPLPLRRRGGRGDGPGPGHGPATQPCRHPSPPDDRTQRILMAQTRRTLMDPPIEDLLDKVDSKFTLVALASRRARQVNSYYNSLGEGIGVVVPPQVASVSGKPLSIAFEEVAAGKATYTRPDPDEEAAAGRGGGAGRGGRPGRGPAGPIGRRGRAAE